MPEKLLVCENTPYAFLIKRLFDSKIVHGFMKLDSSSESRGDCKNNSETVAHAIFDSDLSGIGGNLNETDPSVATESSWNLKSDLPGIQLDFNDLFEGILYRMHVSESKLNISFVSSVFFETFKNKIHADYMSNVDIDRTSFMSKCTTHINGAKCNLKLDAHFKSVELSGIGYKKMERSAVSSDCTVFFKRVM